MFAVSSASFKVERLKLMSAPESCTGVALKELERLGGVVGENRDGEEPFPGKIGEGGGAVHFPGRSGGREEGVVVAVDGHAEHLPARGKRLCAGAELHVLQPAPPSATLSSNSRSSPGARATSAAGRPLRREGRGSRPRLTGPLAWGSLDEAHGHP